MLLLHHPRGVTGTYDSHAAVPQQDLSTKLEKLLTCLQHPPGLTGTHGPHAKCGTVGC